MTSPLQRPEASERPARRLFPADPRVTAAVLACLALLGLGLSQFAFMWPGVERAAETYRYASIVLVTLWGGAGLLRHLAGRRDTNELKTGICVAAFLAWQALLPGFMADLTRRLPPVIPAEAYITATPTPIPTATPLPTRLIGVAKVDGLDVRAGPGTHYPAFARLGRGNMLEVNGRDQSAEWVHVVWSDGRTAWVARGFMYLHDGSYRPSEPLGLPVLPAPTPVP